MGRERRPSQDLRELSEAVAKWRAEGGGRGTKIPEELWNEAVRVARVDGVWLTAKATRFKYEKLRELIARADGSEGTTAASEIHSMEPARANERRGRRRRGRRTGMKQRTSSSSSRAAGRQANAFVELTAAQLLGSSSAAGTVVEVEDKAGRRMIVRLAKEAHVDVAKLVWAFRRRGG